MPEVLYHISDDPAITSFEPRPAPTAQHALPGPVVWAIDAQHKHNYLLPRDCPRVTFYALPESTPTDVERFLGTSSATYVIAIETGWLARVRSERLYVYELPGTHFTLFDAGAGYYIASTPIVPRAIVPLDDLLSALLQHHVELRIMPSLWKLHDAIIASSLQFSIIRMRNALPRQPHS